MRNLVLLIVCSSTFLCATAQDVLTNQINTLITRHEAEAHLAFLAADEMRGRNTGSNELDIAANYIRTYFKILGLKPAPGTTDYFQPVSLLKYSPARKATVVLGKDQYEMTNNVLVLDGGSVDWSGEFIYVGYGAAEDLAQVDVKGKMVLALAGAKDADNINKVYSVSRDKHAALKKAGAKGLVELLVFPQVPWSALINYFYQDKWTISEGEDNIPFVWVKPGNIKNFALNETKKIKGKLLVENAKPQPYTAKNVAAMVEGTDPLLKNEYIIITAHYDHIGVSKEKVKGDSINNGARDNATGTVAVLQAAKYFANHPPKRSVILMTLTGEEKGMLGSRWYVKNPLVPLQKTVLNINSDGVGYNDKGLLTTISLGRTNMDDLITRAADAYSLRVGGDPDPREGFYERSDQVSFAKEGIPAIKLQPGLAEMNNEILEYYHRPADEVSSLDMDYITTFYRAFVYAVYSISQDSRRPAWKSGDKFEQAYQRLYGQ